MLLYLQRLWLFGTRMERPWKVRIAWSPLFFASNKCYVFTREVCIVVVVTRLLEWCSGHHQCFEHAKC